MTLTQIKQLQDKKVQERDNLTLNQLKEENKNLQQVACSLRAKEKRRPALELPARLLYTGSSV
ncbi:MAG: hypothetical protein M0Q43_01085 [Methanothrix sp.]|jgi:hypothetical protein|nr:hypothetical protein [Methanothrix sp.]